MLDLAQRGLPRPFEAAPAAGRRRPRAVMPVRCALESPAAGRSKPAWAGDDALSRLVNALISVKPLFSLMKVMARRTFRQTAEKAGVPWSQTMETLANTQEVLDQIREELEDRSLQYPAYYMQPFHAYDAGNLDWTAAFEAEPATLSMALRTWKDPSLTGEQAHDKLRANVFRCLEAYQQQQGARPAAEILDVGCSVGVSARCLAARYPRAQVTGLDLSPHFLAVAELRERTAELSGRQRVRYLHRLAEDSRLPEASFDLVHLGFVIHECPMAAIAAIAAEAHRLLRPGGVLAVTDNNPRSETIQNLPPALFTLMKSTEPWSDEYYQADVEGILEKAGFAAVQSRECDHRHRTLLGLKA